MLRLTVRPDAQRPVRVTLSTATVAGISLIASGIGLALIHTIAPVIIREMMG